MNIIKKAFTISEVLVVVLAIGILAVLTMSNVSHLDKRKIKYGKAFSLVQHAAQELISDSSLYPDNPLQPGFKNTIRVNVPEGKFLDCEQVGDGASGTCGSKSKLPILLMNKLKISDNIEFEGDYYLFQTADTIEWRVKKEVDTNDILEIIVDYNNKKDPNDINAQDDDRDRFFIYVYNDGSVKPKINADGSESLEQKMLKETSLIEKP